MKKIITMVGASIFENYFEKNDDKTIKNYYDVLKEKREKDWDNEKARREGVEKAVRRWIQCEYDKKDVSAEIKSLLKLQEELKEDFEIYFLCSDTIVSRLVGEIIKDILPDTIKSLNIQLKVISGLQIWDRKEFNAGMSNLIREIYNIAGGYWDNVIINITGGYKATIPYLTILAQINRCPIYYIFEETDALIKIPIIPIDIKWSIFENNEKFFFELEKNQIKEIDEKLKIDPDITSLLEFADNLYNLNPLGVALWERYKSNFEFFYLSEEVKNYLERNPERKRIFEKSVCELKRRLKENPAHPDLNHSLKNINLPEGFKTFKHKEEDLQVRILYKDERYNTVYGSVEISVYVGLIAIGSEVHNAESEYVETFEKQREKIKNLETYEFYKIKKEV
ncbi:MAG: putative CRISPR-associated protein [Candidatus Omnitrophica bacterium]|nr:putative CRISPR-associated protein [Candidatus Omnitrophota bacterium]